MLDNRIHTFLKLCELMNYRKTAEVLNMTQPAVTQHIPHLEEEYGCRLFNYNGRVLSKTEDCFKLESHLRGMLYNEARFRKSLCGFSQRKLSIGATKTIGDYTLAPYLPDLLRREDLELEVLVDNTEKLLAKLNALQLDLVLIEGFFNRDSYCSEVIKQEELVGICSVDHPFANRTVRIEELFGEHILLREAGSGTRAVLEQFLREYSYSVQCFRRRSSISSFRLIQKAVESGCGISFVYESIPKYSKHLATFRIEGRSIIHEFNCVFLPNTPGAQLLHELNLPIFQQ